MTVPPGARHTAYLAAIFVGGGLLALGKLPAESWTPVAVWAGTFLAGLAASFTRTPGDAERVPALERRIGELTSSLGQQRDVTIREKGSP